MKKCILLLVAALSVCFSISTTYADTLPTNSITPYATAYGDGGVSKIEIHDNRSRAWWYARPYIKSHYTFIGTVSITLTNGRNLIYPVSRGGGPGQSVSGSIYVNGKIRKVEFWGAAAGPGGVSVVIPGVETNNHAGGGSGMSVPILDLLN